MATHTLSFTRKLEKEVEELYGEPDVFRLEKVHHTSKDSYALYWYGRFTTYLNSRKEGHEWIINQMNLRKELLSR